MRWLNKIFSLSPHQKNVKIGKKCEETNINVSDIYDTQCTYLGHANQMPPTVTIAAGQAEVLRRSAGAGYGVIVISLLVGMSLLPSSILLAIGSGSVEFPMPIKCGFHIVIRQRLSIWQCPRHGNEQARRSQGTRTPQPPVAHSAWARMSCQSKLISSQTLDPREPRSCSAGPAPVFLHVQLMCKLTLSSARTVPGRPGPPTRVLRLLSQNTCTRPA